MNRLNKLFKIFVILFSIFVIFVISVTALDAAKLHVLFQCQPKILQKEFARYGLKLDLDSEEFTSDSFAILKNEGSEFWIYTYYRLNGEEFYLLRDIIIEYGKKLRDNN